LTVGREDALQGMEPFGKKHIKETQRFVPELVYDLISG
jgi:hypothetical protein